MRIFDGLSMDRSPNIEKYIEKQPDAAIHMTDTANTFGVDQVSLAAWIKAQDWT